MTKRPQYKAPSVPESLKYTEYLITRISPRLKKQLLDLADLMAEDRPGRKASPADIAREILKEVVPHRIADIRELRKIKEQQEPGPPSPAMGLLDPNRNAL